MNVSSEVCDVQGALRYFEDVKSEYADDLLTFQRFLRIIHDQLWTGSSIADVESAIIHATTFLKASSKHLYGFNAVLGNGYRIECRIDVERVDFFVLCTPLGARILSCWKSEVPEPSSTRKLCAFLASGRSCEDILSRNTNATWLGCLSQLLQVMLDKETCPRQRREAFQFLHVLAKRSILPPSLLLNDVTPDSDFAISGGGFADIYKGRSRNQAVCLKVIRMFSTPPEARQKAYKAFTHEALVWRQLDHPNVLPFLGASEKVFPSRYCLISPWMRNGNIMAYLERHPNHDRLTSICEIAEGVRYLHGLNPPITHKDIKGTNVLVKDNLVCCLADFGLSSIIVSQRLSTSDPLQGSIPWLAPEIMDPSRFPGHKPGLRADIYALGCTIYEIYTGKPPFTGAHNPTTIMFDVLSGKRPSLPPHGYYTTQLEEVWSLVDQCWLESPSGRPDILQVQQILKGIMNPVHEEDQHFPPPVAGCETFGLPGLAVYHERSQITEWLRRELSQDTSPKTFSHFSLPAAAVSDMNGIGGHVRSSRGVHAQDNASIFNTQASQRHKRLATDNMKPTQELPTVTPFLGNLDHGNIASEGGEPIDKAEHLPWYGCQPVYEMRAPEAFPHYHSPLRPSDPHYLSSSRSLLTPPITPRPKSTFGRCQQAQLPPTPNTPSYDSSQFYPQVVAPSINGAGAYPTVQDLFHSSPAGQHDKPMKSMNESLPKLRLLSNANMQGPTPPSTPLREFGFVTLPGQQCRHTILNSRLRLPVGIDHQRCELDALSNGEVGSSSLSRSNFPVSEVPSRTKRGYPRPSPLSQLPLESSERPTDPKTYGRDTLYSCSTNRGLSRVGHSVTNSANPRRHGLKPTPVPFVPLVEESESEGARI